MNLTWFVVCFRHGPSWLSLSTLAVQSMSMQNVIPGRFFVVIDLIAMVATSVQVEPVRDVEQGFFFDSKM